jgi:hypothetical protein
VWGRGQFQQIHHHQLQTSRHQVCVMLSCLMRQHAIFHQGVWCCLQTPWASCRGCWRNKLHLPARECYQSPQLQTSCPQVCVMLSFLMRQPAIFHQGVWCCLQTPWRTLQANGNGYCSRTAQRGRCREGLWPG